MEVLHPLSDLSDDCPMDGAAVTVMVNHTVRLERQAAFMEALRELMAAFDRFPGALGYKVFRQDIGADRVRITVLERFASAADHEAWRASEAMARWRDEISEPEQTLESIHRYTGMEALFAAGTTPSAPARWKMAVVLFIAVLPLALLVPKVLAPLLEGQGELVKVLAISPLMVILMTYVMVPLLMRLFRGWLNGKAS